MVELVIKIPEHIYDILECNKELIKEIVCAGSVSNNMKIQWAILNGTPLPKGHGRIGDLDALREEISSWGMNDYEPSDFIDEIDMADVIIEADKESEEK